MSHTSGYIEKSEISYTSANDNCFIGDLAVGDYVNIVKETKEDGEYPKVSRVTKISKGWGNNVALHFDDDYLDEAIEVPGNCYIRLV